MFGIGFYPTPPKLIEKMLSKVAFERVRSALEPSAGKGDIAKAVMSREVVIRNDSARPLRVRKDIAVDVIEIDENLRHILKGEKFCVVHDDFLDFHTFKQYDLVVMNPPFADGDKHLMKALDTMQHGGQIVCLLNAETIRNPYSRVRAELRERLLALNAEIEYIGGAFEEAERQADVEIAMVYVDIPKKQSESIILDHLRRAQQIVPNERTFRGIIPSNYIDGLVAQYNAEVGAGLALIDDYEAMCPLLSTAIGKDGKEISTGRILALEIANRSQGGFRNIDDRNQYVEAARYKYWKALFQSPEITDRLTSNLQSELHSKVEEFVKYDFTFFNIFQLLEDLSKQTGKSIEATILKLFDEFLRYALQEGSKNVHYFNGWRTNSAHKVNKKVILPWLNAWDWSFNPSSYEIIRRLEDIERAFDFLDGKRTENVSLRDALKTASEKGQSSKIPTKYFLVTFYKKGTCHLEFLNPDLLKKFNLFGSQRKNWLPPSYGKKAYRDMEPEEQAVVDSFEGRASYEAVMKDRKYFIVEESGFAMLGPGPGKEAA